LDKAIVIKIGGATLGSHDTTIADIVALQERGRSLVIVHGGGKMITSWLEKRGIKTRFINGERVTDEQTLGVVVSVLAGVVNKEIVADINARGGLAIGISGVDGGLIQGKFKNKELGYVGEVARINPAWRRCFRPAIYRWWRPSPSTLRRRSPPACSISTPISSPARLPPPSAPKSWSS